ncbi:hypothetical protein [Vibrio parahaemolyticus]|uniref:hypothetical protein n=1 Tax=Vibrio parahaemolyticus TaxID=670 RepID=UPI001058FDB1|nr:hypothetical protein [Vibrio parahaemolyticus]
MTRSIYRSLRTLSYREKEIRKQKFPKFSSTLTGKVQLLSFGLFAVAFLSVFAYYLSEVELIKTISMFTLLLAYIANISQPIFALFENRKSIVRFIDNPLIKYFESAEETSYIRARYIRYLARKPVQDIKLVLSQLEEEKSDLVKRISLLVGSIDKFGLMPGLIALAASWDKIENINYDWVLAIAYAVPVFYGFAIFGHLIVTKLQSHITLLELVVDENENT